MIPLAELKAELDAAYPELVAEGRDGTIADALNAVDAAHQVAVKPPMSQVFGYIDRTGRWPLVVLCADHGLMGDGSTAPLALRLACIQAVETRRWSRYEELDVHHPAFPMLLDAMVAGGVLTATHKLDLLALGFRAGSRAEMLWGPGAMVDHMTVAEARRI